jgi:hypothetical protein
VEIGGQLHADFFGAPFGEHYQALLVALSEPQTSSRLASLWLRGPDEGANGTQNWDLCPLVDRVRHFSALREFRVQLTQPADHNRSIIASSYDEGGVLSRLLAKAPVLRNLTVPSAPSAEFFQVGERPIQHLSVDAGFDHQNFILNLSASSCFPELRHLEFGEYNETYMEECEQHCTPLAHYQALFASPAFKNVRLFVWRNPYASEAEVAALQSLRPDLSLLVIRTSAKFVRAC